MAWRNTTEANVHYLKNSILAVAPQLSNALVIVITKESHFQLRVRANKKLKKKMKVMFSITEYTTLKDDDA